MGCGPAAESDGDRDPPAAPRTASTPARFDPGFENGGDCPRARAPHLPPRAGCVTSAAADLDGDGSPDRVAVYAVLEGAKPKRWSLDVRLETGSFASVALAGSRHSYPVLVGAVDADADGDDDLFVKLFDHLYHGAGQAVMRIFQWDGSALVPVRRHGKPLDFRVGGVTQWGEGAHCDDVDDDGRPELILHRIETHDHAFKRWVWREQVFTWRGSRVDLVDRRSGAIVPDAYIDPRVRFYYGFSCGSLDPPYPY